MKTYCLKCNTEIIDGVEEIFHFENNLYCEICYLKKSNENFIKSL